MKSLGLALALASAGALTGRAAGANEAPAMGWHFAGLDALQASNPGAALNEIGALAKSGFLANQIRSRLTQHLPGWFELPSQQLSAEIVAPLVADLLAGESAARFDGETLGTGPWVVAVRLDSAGVHRWSGGLLTIGRRLGLGEPEPLKVEGLAGWRIPAKGAAGGFSFVTHPNWALITGGFKEGTTANAWAAGLAKDGRPLPSADGEWLRLDLQPSAVGWNPKLPFAGKIAHLSTTFAWQGKNVRTTAKLALADAVKISTADWQIPKGIARDPLVSFTAVRNLRTFFSGLDPVKGLNAGLIPDQWYGWSRGSVAFIDDFAVPVSDARQLYTHLERSVPASYNAQLLELALGQWLVATNSANPRLLWRGLPVFVPYVGPRKDGDQDFLYGGIFPLTEQTNATPAPAELFAQFESRKELVYYDWEITPARLAAYEQASPFTALFLPVAKAGEDTHGADWLKEIQPQLSNVVTEITSTGPRELALTRRSQLGMTGIELWLLTRWLDSQEFPDFPYSKPQKPTSGARPAGLPAPGGPGHP